MQGREEQLAMIEAWLANNPGETLTSLARRANLATTTLTRWVNQPTYGDQALKGNTFRRIAQAMGEPTSGFADSLPDQTAIEGATAPLYSILRAVHTAANPLGPASGVRRPLNPRLLPNPGAQHILLDMQSKAMEPTVPHGSLVAVEVSKASEKVTSGLYLIVFEQRIDLRRLEVDFDQIHISADRPGYQDHRVPLVDTARLQVLGRAVSLMIERSLL